MKRGLKAFLYFSITIIIILLFALKNYSFATNECPTITVENREVHRGQQFSVNLNLTKNTGLATLKLIVSYDEAISLISVQRGSALTNSNMSITNPNGDHGFAVQPFYIFFDSQDTQYSTGVLCTLIFESEITTSIGDYALFLDYDHDNTRFEYGVSQSVTIINGTITLIEGAYKVIYYNFDKSILYQKDFNEGEAPYYLGSTPTRLEDECYKYDFKSWVKVISDNPNEICYQADYQLTPKKYQVLYYVSTPSLNKDFELLVDEVRFFDYNSPMTLPEPYLKDYTFIGWYLDENFSQKFTGKTMPCFELTLYGYFKFNVREDSVPVIELRYRDEINNYVFVDVYVNENPGLANLILTVNYDQNAFTLAGINDGEIFKEMQFTHTNSNTNQGYGFYPFKFYWNSIANNYETGKLLTLFFSVNQNAPKKGYPITFSYKETSDATYYEDGSEWYTKINIIEAVVPIGRINSWIETEEYTSTNISVETEKLYSSDIILEVEYTNKINVSLEERLNVLSDNQEIISSYNVYLKQNGVLIEPNDLLTVSISLSEKEQKNDSIKLYAIENGKMVSKDFKREGNIISFQTDKLSQFVLTKTKMTSLSPSLLMTLILAIFLAIICLLYIFIVLHKKKNQEII